MSGIELAERGLVPDAAIRLGIRKLCAQRLREEFAQEPDRWVPRYKKFLEELRDSPIAIHTDAANRQHYEVPPAFFTAALGPHLKYSGCWFDTPNQSLADAERAMLQRTCERAQLADGQRILEMGCGWGSLTLWMAEHYPNASITAVSNSAPQREFIMARAQERGLSNINVITADMNAFETDQRFDRAVSVEMFEHMRNYQSLMARISQWLDQGGKLFVHIFCHRYLHYPFEVEGEDNWLGRYFFTGGVMPAYDTLLNFQQALVLEDRWWVPGTHYQHTSNAWLRNTDAKREEILAEFGQVYGSDEAKLWLQRWRIFFMSCAELFGYDKGREWIVGHYLFRKRLSPM